MNIKLLMEHHLEFLSLKGGYTGSFESTLVKMPYCWKSHVEAHKMFGLALNECAGYSWPLLSTYVQGLFITLQLKHKQEITRLQNCLQFDNNPYNATPRYVLF